MTEQQMVFRTHDLLSGYPSDWLGLSFLCLCLSPQSVNGAGGQGERPYSCPQRSAREEEGLLQVKRLLSFAEFPLDTGFTEEEEAISNLYCRTKLVHKAV